MQPTSGGALSQAGMNENEEFFKNLARSLVSGNPDESMYLCAYLKYLTTDPKQCSDLTIWVQSLSFLILLAWCLYYSIPRSPLETLLLNALLDNTCSLSQEQKQKVAPALKASLHKLPLSSVGEKSLISTDRECVIVFLYLSTFEVKEKVLNPYPTPPKFPPLGEDPFPFLLEAVRLAAALTDYCWSKRRDDEGKNAEKDETEKKARNCAEADLILQQLVSHLSRLLSFDSYLARKETFIKTLEEDPDDTYCQMNYQSICKAYAEGVSLDRIENSLPSLLSLVEDQAKRAEEFVASRSLPHLLFLFRQPSTLLQSPPSSPPLPYVLPFSFLPGLLSGKDNSFSHLFRLVIVGLNGIRTVNEEKEEGRRGEEGREEERMMALGRGGYSLAMLFRSFTSSRVLSLFASDSSLLLSLLPFLHLTHSLHLSSSFPPSLSEAIQDSKEQDPNFFFDPTRPPLLPLIVRWCILCVFINLFYSPTPLSFLSSLLSGGVVKRVGCVVDRKGELADLIRGNAAYVFGNVHSQALKNRKKIQGTLEEEEDVVDEKATEEERREFISLAQDALEEEGAEDSLLLLAGVDGYALNPRKFFVAARNAKHSLVLFDIIVRPLNRNE